RYVCSPPDRPAMERKPTKADPSRPPTIAPGAGSAPRHAPRDQERGSCGYKTTDCLPGHWKTQRDAAPRRANQEPRFAGALAGPRPDRTGRLEAPGWFAASRRWTGRPRAHDRDRGCRPEPRPTAV